MRPSHISRQVLVAGTLPAFVIAVILAAWLVGLRVADMNAHQMTLGQAVVSQLAPAAEYGVFSGNHEALQHLAESALNATNDLRAVTIMDRAGTVLAHAAPREHRDAGTTAWFERLARRLVGEEATRHFTASVMQPATDIGLLPVEDQNPVVLGAVQIEIPVAPALAVQLEAVALGFLVLALGMLISALLAVRLGRRIAGPIETMAEAMRRLSAGETDVHVPGTSKNELGMLESGLNRMATEISRTRAVLEEQVERATSDLRETVEALEVSNVELDLARKRAIEASLMKSEFLAAMSHDIRTPMTGLLGFTRLLAKTGLDSVQAEHLRTIEGSAQALLRIINNILDLSRIESGRLQLADEAFDIRACIDEVLTLMSSLAYERGLTLTRCVERQVPWMLRGDPVRFREVVSNLLSNAIKFTESGGVTVDINIAESETAGPVRLVMIVTDSGSGIDDVTGNQLFQAFTQGAASTARYPGSGLGLVICNRLLGAMGGGIEWVSTPGHGSTFRATMVLQVEDVPATETSKKGPILLIEPDARNAEHITQLLEHAGYEVTREDGSSAIACIVSGSDEEDLERARQFQHIVVLMDNFERRVLANAVHLPRVASQGSLLRALRDESTHSPAPGQPDTSSLAGQHILVVDDHRITRLLFRRQLENGGASVTEAANGPLALALGTNGFDLALIDLQMPGMSGHELSCLLSGSEHSPIIFAITADATADPCALVFNSGCSALMIKPIDETQLTELLGTALVCREMVTASVQRLDTAIQCMLGEDLPMQWAELEQARTNGALAAAGPLLHQMLGVAAMCGLAGVHQALEELRESQTERAIIRLYSELAMVRWALGGLWKDVTG